MAVRFHTDVVGSFLRPPWLLDARAHGMSGEELRALEDRAILEVIRLQEDVGLPVVTDGEFRRGHWTHLVPAIADGFTLLDTGYGDRPVPVAPLRQTASVVDIELAFVRAHTTRPVKVTLPSPSALGLLWTAGVSDTAYPTREAFVEDLAALLNREAKALAAAGAAYLQLDVPHYTTFPAGTAPETYRTMVATDNRVFEGVDGVMTGAHLCRGNFRHPADRPASPYDPYAAEVFARLRVDRLLLEYDEAQAGDFAPLRHVPPEVSVALGLVTTKWPTLEAEEALIRRIEEATRYVPLERLALSPQCGFSSLATLQNMTPADQRAKLELIVRVAGQLWRTT